MINIKKLLMLTLIPLVLSLLAAPAMAKSIGPQKAVGKNPHIMPTPEGVEALLPSGSFNEWTANTSAWYMDFVHGLDASKAKIRNAMPLTMADLMELMTDPAAALEAENKWGYMSYDVLLTMFMVEFPDNVTALIAYATAGQPNVTVADASLFSINDKVLITNGTAMELNVIADKVDDTLTMENDLINDYMAGVSMVVKSPTAEAWAAMWPEGIYVRYVNVGK